MLAPDAPILALADELERAVRRLRTNIEDEQPTEDAENAVVAKLGKLQRELLADRLAAARATAGCVPDESCGQSGYEFFVSGRTFGDLTDDELREIVEDEEREPGLTGGAAVTAAAVLRKRDAAR